VTALALHELTGWSGERIVKHIKSRRGYALCNDTFAKYLKENLKEVDKTPPPQ
jgi:phage major head subunit gpT-like protein